MKFRTQTLLIVETNFCIYSTVSSLSRPWPSHLGGGLELHSRCGLGLRRHWRRAPQAHVIQQQAVAEVQRRWHLDPTPQGVSLSGGAGGGGGEDIVVAVVVASGGGGGGGDYLMVGPVEGCGGGGNDRAGPTAEGH
jgi:hypothetical protein